MPIIYDVEKNETIQIPFPKKKFQAYLKKLKVKNAKDLTFAQKKKIFIASIADFKKGKLSLDEMASITLLLWDTMSGQEKATTRLADALYNCSELSYYVRNIDKKRPNVFNDFINEVMEYYERNKK